MFGLFQTLTIFIYVLLIFNDFINTESVYELNGHDWNVFSTNKQSNSIPSTVPGSIYTDLKNNGILNEFYSDFEDVTSRWVAKDNWTFIKEFSLDSNFLNHDKIYLTCFGLDTIGTVYLNGHNLGSTDNMFIRYRWPVKELLNEKQNVIQISFISAISYARERFLNESITIPPVCVPKEQNGECHVNFIRKMQASFSWDWGPAFPTQGIWQPIVLEAYDSAIIRSISVDTIPEPSRNWFLNTTIWMEGRPNSIIHSANLVLYLNNEPISQMKEFSLNFNHNGECPINVFLMIPPHFSIQPWFPNGLGPQKLYELKVIVQMGKETVNKKINIGFRVIKLIQERLKSSKLAYSFYFQVNGFPIFSKGSNWIPAHVLIENISKEYMHYLLWSAKEANMNMLRVWGGGIYELDYFYELADQYGILIWHDMMFACALYPTDDKFIQSVSTEVRQQIRRLQHHPSIALWAGNNENEVAIANSWWPDEIIKNFKIYKDDYIKLYIKTIMPIVIQEDPYRPFVSSSPSNGIMTESEDYISRYPDNPCFGDTHHYISLGDAWNWKTAPSAKFVSEYGFQSLPSLGLLQKYISTEYLKYPFDEGLMHREHQRNGIIFLTNFMSQHFNLPDKKANAEQLNDFIYLSQIFQAMAIKVQTEFYRRNRQVDFETGKGFTMGALYWQLNNIWPGFSWSSIEYEGKWKMLHYFIRKIFDNLLVDVYENENYLNVMIIRDDFLDNVNFTVTISIYDWSKNKPIYQFQTNCLTKHFGVTLAYKENLQYLKKISKCPDDNHCFIQVQIQGEMDDQKLIRDNFLLLGKLKLSNMKTNPKIHLTKISGPNFDSGSYTFDLEIGTNYIAAFVWIDFDPRSKIFAILSDNGFLLIDKKTIQLRTSQNISKETLINSLVIKTFNSIKN